MCSIAVCVCAKGRWGGCEPAWLFGPNAAIERERLTGRHAAAAMAESEGIRQDLERARMTCEDLVSRVVEGVDGQCMPSKLKSR